MKNLIMSLFFLNDHFAKVHLTAGIAECTIKQAV